MRSALISGSLMTAALSIGCLADAGSIRDLQRLDDADPVVEEHVAYRPIRGVLDGRVTGTVGPLTQLDHDASLLSAYDDGSYLSVEAVVELDDRAVMTLLSVSNGAEIFQPGLSATFRLSDYDEEGVQVTMLGCVGQEVGIYDEYDAPADELDVDVTEGATPGELDVSLEARWFDRSVETGALLDTFRTAHTDLTLLR